jgi:hypothetical protein
MSVVVARSTWLVVAVCDISLIEAWRLWWSGDSIVNFHLFGIPILWLGRAGKFLEFIGAATVVADIIGPERLRAFGAKLRGLVTLEDTWSNLKKSLGWYVHFYYSFKNPSEADFQEKRVTFAEIKADPLSYLSTSIALSASIVAWVFSPFKSIWVNFPIFVIAIYFFTFTLGPLGVLLIVGSFNILTFAIAIFVLKPAAALLDRKVLDVWIKLFAFMCLVIGFHFDFLAS